MLSTLPFVVAVRPSIPDNMIVVMKTRQCGKSELSDAMSKQIKKSIKVGILYNFSKPLTT